MENGFSLNTRLTCLSCPRYHVFRATRITADFTVGSSDMSNTRWKKKLKEGFCEELFPSRSHRKHREQVIETRAKSPYFQSITRTVSFFCADKSNARLKIKSNQDSWTKKLFLSFSRNFENATYFWMIEDLCQSYCWCDFDGSVVAAVFPWVLIVRLENFYSSS